MHINGYIASVVAFSLALHSNSGTRIEDKNYLRNVVKMREGWLMVAKAECELWMRKVLFIIAIMIIDTQAKSDAQCTQNYTQLWMAVATTTTAAVTINEIDKNDTSSLNAHTHTHIFPGLMFTIYH